MELKIKTAIFLNEKGEEESIKIEKIAEEIKENKKDKKNLEIKNKYKDRLKCPKIGCDAKLIIVENHNTPHFRTKTNEQHMRGCDMEVPFVKKKIKTSGDTLPTENSLKNKLKTLLNYVEIKNKTNEGESSMLSYSDKVNIENEFQIFQNGETRAKIGIKNVKRKFLQEDYGVFKNFYGVVYLDKRWKKGKDYVLCYLRKNEEGKLKGFICSIEAPKTLVEEIEKEEKYSIALTGKLEIDNGFDKIVLYKNLFKLKKVCD